MAYDFLTVNGRRLAMRTVRAAKTDRPALFWLGGFRSEMNGLKATALFSWAGKTGRCCRLFDYPSHGASEGKPEDFTLSDALAGALAMLDDFNQASAVLVGSSMGGWIALRMIQELAARNEAQKIAGLVLLAPAPDFTEKLLWPSLTKKARKEILEKGVFYQPSAYGDAPYPITRKLIEDAKEHLVMDRPFDLPCPAHILHGLKDKDVPVSHVMELMGVLNGRVTLSLIKTGDHRLSSPDNIAQMLKAVENIA